MRSIKSNTEQYFEPWFGNEGGYIKGDGSETIYILNMFKVTLDPTAAGKKKFGKITGEHNP